ncbi:MAG: phosphate ABC transporter substrate-binding protein [Candidatus Delongbacteria bacterium]|nr:phosphate ABC transporter substrate-binding protein [Candidatus Delongbacteria bacterium]
MKKLNALIGAAFLSLSIMMAVSYAKTTITVKGSDTMVILAQRWAELYMKKNPETVIQVTGGGSGVGISALINGTTDICNASRAMKPSERDKLKQRHNSLGVEIKIAKDGIALYVNEKNPIHELTLEQIKKIYFGQITNWKEVGGQDSKIILYGRENSSGTYVYFKDFVLNGKDYSSMMQSLPGTAAVVNAVARDINGIGYGGSAYGKGIKLVKVKKDALTTGYEPTQETVTKGLYPITRYLYLYVRSRPTGEMKAYIDWILSDEGQAVVSQIGYFPIR